jgi:hypothetical protein
MDSAIYRQKFFTGHAKFKWLKKLKKLTGSRDRLLSFFIFNRYRTSHIEGFL